MDQDAFRHTYRTINERACPYEKSILTNQCGCTQAQRFCIAEREGVQCASATAQATCLDFLDRLRQQARFALKTTDTSAPLTHLKAMRVQVGGLRGLQCALTPEAPAPTVIPDISALVDAAQAAFGSLADLPFGRILPQIAAYRGRQRSGRRSP